MSEPTLAEVADKTIDHIANGVQQIAATIEKLAPGAWEIAVRKHRAEGWVDLVMGTVWLALIGTLFVFTWRRIKPVEDKYAIFTDGQMRFVLGVVSLAAIGIVMAECLQPGWLLVSAPEYYAARDIIAAVHR